MKNFLVTVSVMFFCLYGCKEITSPPLTVAEPASWNVGPVVSEAAADGHYTAEDGTDLPFMRRDFVIRNTGKGAALRIYTINFLSPEGTVLSDALRSALFSIERSKVSDAHGTVVAGFLPVEENHFENRYPDGTAIVAPLCPLDSEGKCKKGFDAADHNTALTIRVTYRGLTAEQYVALAVDKLKSDGTYYVELCVNDYANPIESTTCTQGNSFRIPISRYPEAPPQPFIGLKYYSPIGGYKDYRVIKDWVNMEVNLSCPRKEGADEMTCGKIISDTVVSDETITAAEFKEKCCLADWKDRYCIAYRWEMIETPTPLAPETRIDLGNIPGGGEGTWYPACGEFDPTLASFKGHMITPTPEGKYYKVSIQAMTIDKQTQLESDIVEKIDTPNIISAARVMVQLTWKEGLKTRAELDRPEGVAVDLDLHLIKKKGMDACGNEVGADGLMCTVMSRPGLPIDTPTHDDCHWNDLGLNGEYVFTDCNGEFKTIGWHAVYDLDNRWGGGNYANPEIINLGSVIDQKNNSTGVHGKDGVLDVTPFDDEYLVMVQYNHCQSLQPGYDDAPCQDGGAEYNVHAKVEIFVDGKLAPRAGTQDDKVLSRAEFVIRPYEWIVIGTFTWDGTLVPSTPDWLGDAVVRDVPTTHEKVCRFRSAQCRNVTIWDYAIYETWVSAGAPFDNEFGGGNGECYEYGERE